MCNALGSFGSCSSPGEKAVANAENRSSGSVMFSKYFSNFISFGAMLLRLVFVALYIRYIMSLTCSQMLKTVIKLKLRTQAEKITASSQKDAVHINQTKY